MRSIIIPETVNDPLMQMRGIGPRLRHVEILLPPRPKELPAERMMRPPVERPIPRPINPTRWRGAADRITREIQLAPLDRIRSFIPGYGLSEDAAPGFWSSITGALTSTIQGAIPVLAQVQVAKLQANQAASLLRTQAGLYTPQNLATLQAQGQFEAQQRANLAAAAAGTTSAPLTTGTMIVLGGLALGALLLFRKK